MKKSTTIAIIIIAAFLLVVMLWKSGVFKKKSPSGQADAGDDEGGSVIPASVSGNDEAERSVGSFDELSKTADYKILNPNKQSR